MDGIELGQKGVIQDHADESRIRLAEDSLFKLPASNNKDLEAKASKDANEIVSIVNKIGNFGGPLTYWPESSPRNIVTGILGEAMDKGYTQDLLVALNKEEVKRNSDLRFGLDKKSYFFSTTDSEGEMDLTERDFYTLRLENNLSAKVIDTATNNTQFTEAVPKFSQP